MKSNKFNKNSYSHYCTFTIFSQNYKSNKQVNNSDKVSQYIVSMSHISLTRSGLNDKMNTRTMTTLNRSILFEDKKLFYDV